MSQSTITLSMIVKNEYEAVAELIEHAKPYFDEINITVTNKERYEDFKKLDVNVDYFDWVKDFSKARNHALKNVKTTYWFWLDSDDVFDFRAIPSLVKRMDEEEYDVMYLKYDYAQNEMGESIAEHWRERILRTEHPFKWEGPLHETLISSGYPRKGKSEDAIVHHHNEKTPEEQLGRNVEILEKAYEEGDDPRITMYLGHNYHDLGQYRDAIRLLMEHIRKSGSPEDQYNSWIKVSQSYDKLGQLPRAINAALEAIKLLPDWPQAYFYIAQYEFDLEHYSKAIEWVNTGYTKPQPETLHIIDPTQLTYRPMMLKAMAEVHKGLFEDAAKSIKVVRNLSPNYKPAQDIEELIQEEADKRHAIENIKELSVHFDDKKFDKALFNNLPPDYQRDPRLQPLRSKVKKPKKWADKSVVFFCGQTNENWGPDTLDQGMGGSEEAVVNVARQLKELGYEVTVYNTRDNEYDDNGIKYIPWYLFDYRDEFDTIIVWRVPELTRSLTAKQIFCDVHDVVEPERVYENADNVKKYLVKSNYHRGLYPKLPDDKFAVIGNGLDPSMFKKTKKEPLTFYYGSSPDRGLKTFLEMWPEIKKRHPEAKGYWSYGWNTYVSVQGEDALYHRINQLLDQAEDFENLGRLSHQEQADLMCKTKYWIYPTEFEEIHCMTAIKAEQAGMIPVSNHVAALPETSVQGYHTKYSDIYHNKKAQEEFLDLIDKAIEEDPEIKPPKDVSWESVAKRWADEIG